MKIIDIHTHIYLDDIAQKANDSVGNFYQIGGGGMKGIKTHPDSQRFPIDDLRLFPMHEAAWGSVPRAACRRIVRNMKNMQECRVLAVGKTENRTVQTCLKSLALFLSFCVFWKKQ